VKALADVIILWLQTHDVRLQLEERQTGYNGNRRRFGRTLSVAITWSGEHPAGDRATPDACMQPDRPP
jgi:hypothetical protein